MQENLSGPCCVLCAAMNFDGEYDRREEHDGLLFQIAVAALGAIGFVALFIL